MIARNSERGQSTVFFYIAISEAEKVRGLPPRIVLEYLLETSLVVRVGISTVSVCSSSQRISVKGT